MNVHPGGGVVGDSISCVVNLLVQIYVNQSCVFNLRSLELHSLALNALILCDRTNRFAQQCNHFTPNARHQIEIRS